MLLLIGRRERSDERLSRGGRLGGEVGRRSGAQRERAVERGVEVGVRVSVLCLFCPLESLLCEGGLEGFAH